MKSKRGFTLPEVVIALSITIIVMSLVASLVVIVSKISSNQNTQNTYQTEYRTASALVDDFFNTYNTSTFEIESFQENQVVITNSTDQYVLKFDIDKKELNIDLLNHKFNEVEQKILQFTKLNKIKFTKNDNIIMSEYVFDNDVTYRNIITFGV